MRIRTRLTLWYSAILLGILVVIGALSYSVLRWSLMQDLDSSLMTVAQVVHDTRSDDSDDSDLETILRNLLGRDLRGRDQGGLGATERRVGDALQLCVGVDRRARKRNRRGQPPPKGRDHT